MVMATLGTPGLDGSAVPLSFSTLFPAWSSSLPFFQASSISCSLCLPGPPADAKPASELSIHGDCYPIFQDSSAPLAAAAPSYLSRDRAGAARHHLQILHVAGDPLSRSTCPHFPKAGSEGGRAGRDSLSQIAAWRPSPATAPGHWTASPESGLLTPAQSPGDFSCRGDCIWTSAPL